MRLFRTARAARADRAAKAAAAADRVEHTGRAARPRLPRRAARPRLPRRAAVAATALVLLAGPQLAAQAPASAAPAAGTPSSWAATCDSGRLGLDEDTVRLAPTLPTDTNPNGTPVAYSPDARGMYTPIVMVHGWTGSDTHDAAGRGAFSHRIDLTANRLGTVTTTRSLIGQFQSLPGAAVFTFDYHPYSARWVDDAHLGPAARQGHRLSLPGERPEGDRRRALDGRPRHQVRGDPSRGVRPGPGGRDQHGGDLRHPGDRLGGGPAR